MYCGGRSAGKSSPRMPAEWLMDKSLRRLLVMLLIACFTGVFASPHLSGAAAGLADDCGYHPATAGLLSRAAPADWLSWVGQLSGAEPAIIAGEPYTITTRYTPTLFSGAPHARAYDFVLEQARLWHYPPASIEQHAWSNGVYSGYNLALTIPGQITPTEVVALTAHLDSLSPAATRQTLAPGAEDNASGSAALLQAARLLRHYQFARTVKIIWFTGEEQGLLGSAAFAADHNLSGYRGVINLDMFGYDADDDRCFELHVGVLPASDKVGQCLAQALAAYNLNISADYLTSEATSASDHASFWSRGVGAVLLHENGFTAGSTCGGVRDRNPYYHTVNDTIANSFPPYNNGSPNPVGGDIARLALAGLAGLAGMQGVCFTAAPQLSLTVDAAGAHLSWMPLTGAVQYRLYRRVGDSVETLLYSGAATSYTDAGYVPYWSNWYWVEAVAADGFCLSELSQAVGVVPAWVTSRGYLPLLQR